MSSIAASSSGSISADALAQAQSGLTSLSGAISFAGLGSGTDFQEMITQLKKVEEIPKNRLELWKADWQKRVDSFDELISAVNTLSAKLGSMDTVRTFLTKLVGSTNPAAVTAVASGDAGTGSYRINVTQLAANALLRTNSVVEDPVTSAPADKNTVIAPTSSVPTQGPNYIFSYTYGTGADAVTRELEIPPGTTLQSFVNIINNDTRNPGVRASLIQSGGGYVFQMQGQDTGAANSLNINFSATPPDKFTDLPGFDTLATWYDRPSQDAEFYLDGNENQRFYSASNSLTEVIPGLTITLTDVTDEVSPSTLPGSPGSPLTVVAAHSVMLTVTNDAASAKARAREFVDSLNELLTKFQDLTKYDSSKSTTDRTQSSSQYDAQKGSVLTGNYGVQLLNSRLKSLAAATAKGFDPLELDGTGDVFWSLATIGIHLDADQNSQTFGRFVIDEGESDPESPFSTLDEALERDPQAVAELLAADKIVRGTSSDFSYVGMLRKDMVTAGEHSVRYSVSYDAVSNTNTVDYVFIDGVPASYDSTANEWTSTAKESAGMVIRVDNLGLGQHSGTLNVKQGKINELNELLQAEVAGANMEVGKQTDNKGSLLILKENYLKIIDNIDKKIEQEETRLLLWETRMRMQFARLDTLLAQYQQQMTANAASLAQANNSSSSS